VTQKNFTNILSFFTQISVQYDIIYRSSEPLLTYFTLRFPFFNRNIALIMVLHIPSYRQAHKLQCTSLLTKLYRVIEKDGRDLKPI